MAVSPDLPVVTYGAGHPNALRLALSGLTDIWSRRRLTRYIVQAELAKTGADTVLGNVWWILDPLLQMGVYVVFISLVVGRTTPDYPLFVFCGILPWKWFSAAVNDAILSIVSRERIIKQVHFPKIVLPVASTMSGVVHFMFGLIPLAGLLILLFPHRLSWTLVLIPFVAFAQLVFTLAVGILVSAINVFYRDVGNLARHVLRLWFYLSPGLYAAKSVSTVAPDHAWLETVYWLNPFVVLFESYRDVIYNGVIPNWSGLALLSAVSLVAIGICTWIFKRVEPAFAKVL